MQDFISLKKNDIVIHIEYGLGQFIDVENIKINNIENDFVRIKYGDNSFLLVPVENFDLITKYSDYNPNIKLDRLSKNTWTTRKNKIRKNLNDIAKKLIYTAGLRKTKKGQIFTVNPGSYEDFCNDFIFTPTRDQLQATEDIINDLASGNIMDRLLCGDVGFGKTEVAMRASFVVVDNKYKAQVAIVVPTTLLCRQHYKQFIDRFKNTDFKIGALSRYTTTKEAKDIKEKIKNGEIDILIATHSILGKDIEFKNLGLLIIDEEQLFGVAQKEKLKELKSNVHLLSMSATPIPRTLQMSISGLKDLSVMSEPPINRVAIETIVCEYSDSIIKKAINFEIARKGRVFIVVPRIADIVEVEFNLKKVIPDIKYGVVHGQMNSEKIDIVMNDFYDGKYDVLIATTIVESGIDIPIANTMIIYKANNFGLTQIYQLRGRVGRNGDKAYTYLIVKKSDNISDLSKKRLSIIENIKNLNAGFAIASEDMDIRGTGNLLGEQQTGHLKDIGIELYNKMLKDAIKNNFAKEEDEEYEDFSPEIKLGISTIIPANYIDRNEEKIFYYKKIANNDDEEVIGNIKDEMIWKYGNLPESVENLFKVNSIKNRCKNLNIQKMIYNNGILVIHFYKNRFSGSDRLLSYSFESASPIRLRQNEIQYICDKKLDIFTNIDSLLCKLESFINNY